MNFTVPAVQQALLDALGAHFTGSDQIVAFGLPTKVPSKPERIYVEADEEGLVRTRPAAYTVETYTLRVWVEVRQPGDKPQHYHACSDRRWALADEVAAVVHSKAFRRYLQADRDITAVNSASGPFQRGFVAFTRLQLPIRARG